MDIIERAARQACKEGGFDPDEMMPNDGPRWKYYVPNVRAVLSAIRVPDEGMIEAGSAAIQSSGFVDDATKLGWQAMIDAALKG